MEITTNTIAELYIKQGYFDKAIDIFRAILSIDPENAGAKKKIEELEKMMAGGVEPEIETTNASVTDNSNSLAVQIERLESWLNRIRALKG